MRRIFVVAAALLLGSVTQVSAQNAFRFGTGFTFADSTDFVQSFSFDFNRTEEVKEKTGRKLLVTDNGFMIIPAADINVGKTVSAAENNVFAQLSLGKASTPTPKTDPADATRKYGLNRFIELSPTYMADKNFDEEIVYAQFKWNFNFISTKYSGTDAATSYLKRARSFAFGPVANIGFRESRKFHTGDSYFIAGLFSEFKLRWLTNSAEDNWVLKFSGNGFFIVEEIESLYNDDLAGQFVMSVDKRLTDKLYASVSYKLGNNNPNYKEVNVGEFGLKLKY